jgi:hypothetical protein
MKLIATALSIATLSLTSLPAIARSGGQPYVCAVNATNVNIRDAQTMRTVGQLNWGECLIPYNWQRRKNSFEMRTIGAEAYFMVVGGSGLLRMVPARYVEVVYR